MADSEVVQISSRKKKSKKDEPKIEVVATPVTDLPKPRVFEYKRLSASMLKTFLTCRRKFYLHYIKGVPEAENESFTLGTACHDALEHANISLMQNPRELNPFEISDYVQQFRDKAATLHITDLSLFEEGEDIIRRELHAYDLNVKIIGIEQEFDLVTPEGVRIYGFIDKLEEVDESTIRIVDYKTSRNPMSYDEARTDEQLSMYDLAVAIKYPQYTKRLLELRYLRPGESLKIERNQIEQQNFRRQLLAIDKAIKEFVSTVVEAPKGQMNDFCTWCSFKAGCPQYVEVANTLLPDAPSTFDLTESTFVDLYEKVSAISKAAEAWKDALKLWASEQFERDPDIQLNNGTKLAYTMSSTRREYDTEKVCRLIGLDDLLGASTDGKPLVKIQTKVLEDYLKFKKNKKLEAKVENLVDIKFNAPQIRLKKAENVKKAKKKNDN